MTAASFPLSLCAHLSLCPSPFHLRRTMLAPCCRRPLLALCGIQRRQARSSFPADHQTRSKSKCVPDTFKLRTYCCVDGHLCDSNAGQGGKHMIRRSHDSCMCPTCLDKPQQHLGFITSLLVHTKVAVAETRIDAYLPVALPRKRNCFFCRRCCRVPTSSSPICLPG